MKIISSKRYNELLKENSELKESNKELKKKYERELRSSSDWVAISNKLANEVKELRKINNISSNDGDSDYQLLCDR